MLPVYVSCRFRREIVNIFIMSSRDYKEQVLAAVPIESYIGRFVPLKRAGKRLTGLCPFHGEKTPSFSVTPDKGLFYCFGCGKGGDLLRFVMDYEGLNFPEALETLGRFAGIEKPKNFGGRKNDPREKLFDLNERVARTFAQYLTGDAGREQFEYLRSRGVSVESIESFGLGGSPESWDWLREKFAGHTGELVELGLLKAGQQEGRPPYDFFRNRVMFPIRDGGGRYVAFGGRAMPGAEKQAKYINSPESSVFHKSQVLYGLYHGLGEIRAKGECFLVEGYMDVIGLHQAGYRTACAPLGTALTPDHLKLISRYTSNLICIFDGDRAGRNAALKFARLCIEQGGLQARVILLPAGQDPFDLTVHLPAPALEEILGTEFRIPAERFYLLETMFPDHFADAAVPAVGESTGETSERTVALRYAERARDYYTGQLPSALPRGTEKRPGLDRLFAELGGLGRDSDRLLLLEEAAHLLGLNANEVRREWQQSPHSKAAARLRTSPAPVERREPAAPIPVPPPERTAGATNTHDHDEPDYDSIVPNDPGDFGLDYSNFENEDPGYGEYDDAPPTMKTATGRPVHAPDVIRREPARPIVSNTPRPITSSAPRSASKGADAIARRLIACERALLVELFLAPALISAFQTGIASVEFVDPHAEFFWRYLETRYLTGNIWTVYDLSRFELPEETMQVFSAQVLRRVESAGPRRPGQTPGTDDDEETKAEERLQITVLNDLLLEIRILDLKKKIAEIGSRYVVADSVDQSYLIHENGRLVKELKELELQRRNSGQPVS